MNKFIKLNEKDSSCSELWVNVANIVYISRVANEVHIGFPDGSYKVVSDSFEDVMSAVGASFS